MSRLNLLRQTWFILLVWCVLFALVVYSAYSQNEASLGARLGIIYFWGLVLTGFALLLHRKPISNTVEEEFPLADEPSTPAEANWQIAEERNAWLEIFSSMKPKVELQDFLQGSAIHLRTLFPNASLSIYLRNEQNILDLRLRVGDSYHNSDRMTMSECPAISRGSLVEDASDTDTGAIRHSLYIPLKSNDYFSGSLHLHLIQNPDQSHHEWVAQSQKAQLLGSNLSQYLRNLHLEDRISGHMIRDQWTGLFNRRYMEETLTREFAEATRRSTSIGVVMFSPDHADEIRQKIDEKALEHFVLEIAQMIPRYIRTEDIPCRLAASVFCVILPGAGLDIVMHRAEKMRRELGGLEYAHQDQIVQSTFSVGVAIFPDNSQTVHGLISLAEAALRSSQRQGGDKVALPPMVLI